jgi:chemotaxis protein methyltransferase CheR
MFRIPFAKAEASMLATAIVDSVREPLVVLDPELRVVAASRSFYRTFTATPQDTQGKLFYELRDGEWDIPKLRSLLGNVQPDEAAAQDCEVEHEFRRIGRRTMRLNARRLAYGRRRSNILLGIEDVTGQRLAEREKDELLRRKDLLLGEIQHRVGNSLQVIANIILLKARSVESEETRRHLNEAHDRVISIAAVQQCLHASDATGQIDLRSYLSELCGAIAQAMIGDNRSIALSVSGAVGQVHCRHAESLGLIVTELVINALKHAFAASGGDGRIAVCYHAEGAGWRLSVADDGDGMPLASTAAAKPGLGTGIVKALAQQLGAEVCTLSGPHGTTISVTSIG